jgi:hypothetical protein
MKSTEHGKTAALPAAAPDDEFEHLRKTFYVRLRSDRVRLTTLAASLARIEGHPAGVFNALQAVAHRIRGAAAVFEDSELGGAANALERAATAACDIGADHADGAVWSALEELVERLAMACPASVITAHDLKPILHLSEIADRAGGGPRNTKYRQAKRH